MAVGKEAMAGAPWVRRVLLVALGCLLAAGVPACGDGDGYSQETPDATLRTARKMVERGEAKKIVTLIHADSREMAAVLKRLGSLLGNMQDLAGEIAKAFPQEVEKLKGDVEKGSGSARAQGLLQAFTGGRPPRDRNAARAQQNQFALLIRNVFADPFGWLADQEGRLSTAFVDDSTVAILYDDKPVIPVIGLLMRQRRGLWYIELPTGMPGADKFLPRSREEYSVIGSVVKVFDQVVIDLTADVRTRRVSNLDGLSRNAGEKAFIPMAIEDRSKAPGPR